MLNYLSHLSSSVQGGAEADNVLNVEDAILKSRYFSQILAQGNGRRHKLTSPYTVYEINSLRAISMPCFLHIQVLFSNAAIMQPL